MPKLQPCRALAALLAQAVSAFIACEAIAQEPNPKAGLHGTEITWLGQSAMRITTPGGKVIMIDPFISQNPKTPAEWKDLKRLGHLDLILVTHAISTMSATRSICRG